jgi:putative copper resistance protein D
MDNLADGSDGFPIFPVLLAARWVHFASVFALFGSPFFWVYLNGDYPRARRETEALLRGSALVAALSGLLWLAGIVANMAGGFDSVLDSATLDAFFFQTQFGPVVVLRLVLLAASVVAAFAPMRGQARFQALGAIGGALLINQAWLGHAAEGVGARAVLMVSAYSVHVLAAAAWLGSLPPLLFVLRELRDRPAREAHDAAARVLSAFSIMAALAVAAIFVAGFVNLGFHRGHTAGHPFSNEYCRVLAVKAVLVAAMLVFAAYNRLVATPGLRADDSAMPARVRASIAAEMAVGLLVLAAAAVLGVTPPH